MCDEIGVFTDKEVKNLNPKARKALAAEAVKHFRALVTQGLAKKLPIARVVRGDVRKKLRTQLRPKLTELHRTSAKK